MDRTKGLWFAFLLPVAYVACLMSATGDHVVQLRVRFLARLGIRFVMTIRNGLSRGEIIEPGRTIRHVVQ
jgi:hypothetical protein